MDQFALRAQLRARPGKERAVEVVGVMPKGFNFPLRLVTFVAPRESDL
jgi:hypothetical protein